MNFIKRNRPITVYLITLCSLLTIIVTCFTNPDIFYIEYSSCLSAHSSFLYFFVALFFWINPFSEVLVAEIVNIAVFFVLPILMYTKFAKKATIIMIAFLAVDILGGLWMMLSTFLPSLIYIVYKAFLIFLCVKNLKWYDENYE